MVKKRRSGISLVEVLIAMSLMSTLLLPMGMFVIEYLRGSDSLGDFHQVMNILEEKMELAYAQPFTRIPQGLSEDCRLSGEGRNTLDLRPMQVGRNLVKFSLAVELVPVEFSAIIDPKVGKIQRTRLEGGLKRMTLKGVWGDKGQHSLDLVAYKADL